MCEVMTSQVKTMQLFTTILHASLHIHTKADYYEFGWSREIAIK